MGKVIDIDALEPHLTGELICIGCGHRAVHTWNEKLWFKDLYCPNCEKPGLLIATGQILEAQYSPNCNQDNPKKMSKPGIILDFPKRGEINGEC